MSTIRPEDRLLLLELGLPAAHRVERRARELARAALDEPQVRGERAELARTSRARWPSPTVELRQPLGVERAAPDARPWPCPSGRPSPSRMSPATCEVLVDRLAGDQQVHDLRRALEDPVDAHVAQRLLDRDRLLAAGLQRLRRSRSRGRRGSASARRRPSSPSRRRRASRSPPRCGCRSSCRRPGARRRRASPRGRTRSPAMNAIFCATASCLPTGWPHWTRSARPLAGDLRRPLRDADADRRQREAAGVQRRQGDLQALALAPDQVLLRDEDVLEQRHRVLDAAQAHELRCGSRRSRPRCRSRGRTR